MPIVIPTAAELAQMSKREVDAYRARLGVTRIAVAESRAYLSTGQMIRKEADLWARIIGADPDADDHREALMRAVS